MPTPAPHIPTQAERLAELDKNTLADLVLDLTTALNSMIALWQEKTINHSDTVLQAKHVLSRVDGAAYSARIRAYSRALNHWCQVGYSWETARALASVLHGSDADVRQWARSMMHSRTNLTVADML